MFDTKQESLPLPNKWADEVVQAIFCF